MADPVAASRLAASAAGPAGLVAQLGLYRHLLAAKVRSDWQYRTSFVLLVISQILVCTLDLAVIAVLFGTVDQLGGWSGLEVALLYGLGGVAFGLADVFVSQVEYVARHVREGSFDRFLLRPVWPLLQLSAGEFALRRAGRLPQPLVVLVVALAGTGIDWTPARLVLLPVALASGTVLFGAVWVLTSSVAFWTVETQEFANAFTYGGNHLASYPLDILGVWLRRLATFVVPLAFVAYLPAAYLLGKEDTVGLPPEAAFLAPAVAAGLALLARAVWGSGLRHYRSTGS